MCFVIEKMRISFLDHGFRLSLFAFVLIVANLLFFCNAFADYKVEINHMNEVTHIEIPEISQADYQVDKKGGAVEIQISGLDPKSGDILSRYADQFIKKVTVTRNASLSRDVIRIELNDPSLEMFDYLTDAPSSLSIDFYVNDGPSVVDADDEEAANAKAAPARKKDKVNPKRSIASSEFIKQVQDINVNSELDEIHKEAQGPAGSGKKKKDDKDIRISTFEKNAPLFDTEKVNFKMNAIIENRGKIFIKYPILFNEDKYLAQLLSQKVEYDVEPPTDAESKDFWKIKRLFAKGDSRNFLKAKNIFVKKYPSSRFTEMASYMEAESLFNLYKAEGSERIFDETLKMYDALLSKYPKSNLAERTLLTVAYLRMQKGRYIEAVRSLKSYSVRFATSPLVPNIDLIMAQALLRLQEFEESLRIYQRLLQSDSVDVREKAAFDLGDVFFEKKDYAKAIKFYTQALTNYPGEASKYPNVSFNLGEAQFLSEKYKDGLASYKKFIDLFPQHEYAAYAWTRMGEILEAADVDSKAWRGYYNESYFRFQHTNGGRVAKINLLSHQAQEMDGVKFDMVIEEMRGFFGQLDIPHASDFLTVKIADTYFDKGFYKKATDELISYFQKETIPNYEDKFLRRIGRGISFQVRDALAKNDPQKAFSIFDSYDALWLRKSQRHDFAYLKGLGFEQTELYKKAGEQYAAFLKNFKSVPNQDETITFEQLPALEEIHLRYANCLVQLEQFQDAEAELAQATQEKLTPGGQDEWHILSSKIADSKGDYAGAIAQMEKVLNPTVSSVHWLAELYGKNNQGEKGIAAIDKFLEDRNIANGDRFKLLKQKLGVLESAKNKTKYYDFLKRFYAEFKNQKFDFDREKYQLGAYYAEQSKLKEADDVWAGIGEKSYWKKLAKESRDEKKWDEQYKKYINRIPAMAPGQEIKR